MNGHQPGGPMTARILIVEDEEPLTLLLRYNLEAEGYAVDSSVRGDEADLKLKEHAPDLAVIDWMLPGLSGIELARRLRLDKRTKSIPIIMLTARADEQDKLTGLDTGADDYITKPFSPRELNARVKALLRRRAPQMTDDLVQIGTLKLDPATHRVSADADQVHLGPTEFRLLHFLMTHAERVHSRTQLLDQVWGDHVFVEERTVDVHIRRLRKALEPSRHDGLIQTVRGAGYRLSAN
jgi:two-component system phosphate regulon response regulator PhoB